MTCDLIVVFDGILILVFDGILILAINNVNTSYHDLKTRFGSSLPTDICRKAHVLFTLFVCTLCCQFLWIVHLFYCPFGILSCLLNPLRCAYTGKFILLICTSNFTYEPISSSNLTVLAPIPSHFCQYLMDQSKLFVNLFRCVCLGTAV